MPASLLKFIFVVATVHAQGYLPFPGGFPQGPFYCQNGMFTGTGVQQLDRARQIRCEARREMFLNRLKKENQLPATETLKRLIRENKLVIFGEGHTLSSRTIYPQTLTELHEAEPELNCLFVEANESLFAREKVDPVEGMFFTLKKAEELNIRAIPVDLANGSSDKIRNEVMAETIRKQFETPGCKKGILIVGSNHLKSKPQLDERSIPSLLKNQIPLNSILFIPDSATVRLQGSIFVSRPELVKDDFMTEFCSPFIPKIGEPILFRSMDGDEFEYYLLFHSH